MFDFIVTLDLYTWSKVSVSFILTLDLYKWSKVSVSFVLTLDVQGNNQRDFPNRVEVGGLLVSKKEIFEKRSSLG